MKKQLLFIFSIASTLAIAQPTLTATGINPVLGDVYPFKYGQAVSPGSSGASQTWNLSSIVTSTTVTYNTTLVSATPYASSFPSSNLSYNGGGSYSFINPSSTSLKNDGSVAGTTVMSYSNPEEIMHYPFNMGNTYTDTWAVNFTSGTAFARTGTTTVTYDGYGTLILSSGTYSNVARVHFEQVYKDAYSGGTINYTNNEYMWYSNGNHMPIAATYTLAYDLSPTDITASFVLGNIVTSVFDYDKAESNIKTFPIPAGNVVNFSFENNIKVEKIKLFDVSGKEVYNQIEGASYSGNIVTIKLDNIENGIYFASIICADGQVLSKKITILK